MASRLQARQNANAGVVVQNLPAGVVHRRGRLSAQAGAARANIKHIIDAGKPVELLRYGCVVAVLVPVADAGWQGTEECNRRAVRALRAAAREYDKPPAE